MNQRASSKISRAAIRQRLNSLGIHSKESETVAQQAIDNDPREYNSRTTLADFYEKSGKPELALPIREYLVTIDPYNPMNLLALGRDLKATGDIEGARAIVEKIAAFAPESEELKSAKSEFLA